MNEKKRNKQISLKSFAWTEMSSQGMVYALVKNNLFGENIKWSAINLCWYDWYDPHIVNFHHSLIEAYTSRGTFHNPRGTRGPYWTVYSSILAALDVTIKWSCNENYYYML